MKRYVVDVMIPTYKPGQEFGELLPRLLNQTYPIRSICIVNTGASYWNPSWEQLSPKIYVEHIRPSEFDHGGTRKAMADSSDADLILFMTQDAIPADEYLVEHLVEKFMLPHVKAAYARQLPKEDCRTLERFTRAFNYPEESDIKDYGDLPKMGVKTFFCSNVCAMYDRAVYEELGGFVMHTPFNEDMIYAGHLVQAGYAIAYSADAKVFHSHNYGCMAQLKRNFDLGASQAMHPEIFEKYPSEGEGMKMVKRSARYVIRIHRPWLLIPLFFQSAFKYLGYLLGKHFRSLPNSIIMRCTSNKAWWEYRCAVTERKKRRTTG
ncbi:MAG: glycosyltransferase [Fusicatenibacter sp.]|nr:glycosyltransferase [Fusicatenibacter sp.]